MQNQTTEILCLKKCVGHFLSSNTQLVNFLLAPVVKTANQFLKLLEKSLKVSQVLIQQHVSVIAALN